MLIMSIKNMLLNASNMVRKCTWHGYVKNVMGMRKDNLYNHDEL